MNLQLDASRVQALSAELATRKGSEKQARTDAKIVLTIYAIRERANETGTGGLFGYRTWWLSKDVMTHEAVTKVFGHERLPSVNMRADFLENFIALAPARPAVQEAFRSMFASLAGVSFSYHLPPEIPEMVNGFIKQHASLPHGRVNAILRELSDRIKADPGRMNARFVRHFLDEERERLRTASAVE